MTNPKCAVLLAAYNGMDYIEEQINSILNQRDVDVSLFISVDVSTDGTESYVDKRAVEEPRIHVLAHGLRFGGAAKNFFRLIRDVDLSAFDFIAYSDQDDIWYEDKLKRAVNCLNAENCQGYSSNVTAFWPDGKKILIHKAEPQKPWDYLFEAAGPGCTYVLKQALMMDFKACLEKQWKTSQTVSLHDWYTYAFARGNGYQWVIDPMPTMAYRQHEKNQVGVNLGFRAYFDRIKKIKNGWWLTQARLIAALVGLKEDPFVLSWSQLRRRDFLRLSKEAFSCRRSKKDQLFFILFCFILTVTQMQPYALKD